MNEKGSQLAACVWFHLKRPFPRCGCYVALHPAGTWGSSQHECRSHYSSRPSHLRFAVHQDGVQWLGLLTPVNIGRVCLPFVCNVVLWSAQWWLQVRWKRPTKLNSGRNAEIALSNTPRSFWTFRCIPLSRHPWRHTPCVMQYMQEADTDGNLKIAPGILNIVAF